MAEFAAINYRPMENVGSIQLRLSREGYNEK